MCQRILLHIFGVHIYIKMSQKPPIESIKIFQQHLRDLFQVWVFPFLVFYCNIEVLCNSIANGSRAKEQEPLHSSRCQAGARKHPTGLLTDWRCQGTQCNYCGDHSTGKLMCRRCIPKLSLFTPATCLSLTHKLWV